MLLGKQNLKKEKLKFNSRKSNISLNDIASYNLTLLMNFFGRIGEGSYQGHSQRQAK